MIKPQPLTAPPPLTLLYVFGTVHGFYAFLKYQIHNIYIRFNFKLYNLSCIGHKNLKLYANNIFYRHFLITFPEKSKLDKQNISSSHN